MSPVRGGDRSIRRDERAVSELLGVILAFALLLILLVLAQVTLVPALNAQVEYEHSLRAGDDLGDFGAAATRVASTGAGEGTSVELGVTYPSRPLLVNPGPVTGSLRTTDAIDDGAVVRNVRTDDPEADEYWANDGLSPGVYDTRVLTYEAQYNEHRGGGRTYLEGGTVTFTRYDSADLVQGSGPNLIDGRRISLVIFEGEYQRNTDGSTTLPLTAVSGPARTVSVSDDGTPIEITIRTFLSESVWQDRLADEPHVVQVDYVDNGDPDEPNQLTVELEQGITYELRMASVGIGTGNDRTSAAYLTRESVETPVVPTTGGEVSVDVRDAFNNPVSGTEVTFRVISATNTSVDLSNGTVTGDRVTVTSRADGRAVARVLATGDGVARIEATIEADGVSGTDPHEQVIFDVQIGAGSGAGGDDSGRELNPNDDDEVVYVDSISRGGNACNANDPCQVDVRFWNRYDEEVGIEAIRINSYSPNGPGNSEDNFPDRAEVRTAPATGQLVVVGGPRTDIDNIGIDADAGDPADPTAGGGNTSTAFVLSLRFQEGQGTNSDVFEDYYVRPGAIFVITVYYDDGTRSTYVVTPRGEPSQP